MNIVQYTPEYTNPEVLESAAGFYIGQRYYDGEMGCHAPGGRLSVRYWATQTEAATALTSGNWVMRNHP